MVFVAILPGLTTLIPALVDGEPFNAPTRVLPTVPSTPLTRAVWSMRIMMEWSMNGSLGRNKDDLHLGSNNDCSCLYAWIHVHFDRAGRHDGGWSCEMVYIYFGELWCDF